MKRADNELFKKLAQKDLVSGSGKARSFWTDARSRFFKNRASVVSVVVMVSLVLFAIFGGWFANWSNEEIDWNMLGQVKELGAPSIASGHYFGVDDLGRDLYARLVQASRVSLAIAFISSLIAICLGASLGAIAGYYGGRIDAVLLGANEISAAVPYIIFFVVWQAFFGKGMFHLLLVMALINWNAGFLLVRGQVKILKNKEFVDAARLLGLSDLVIIFKHLFPNMLGLIIINGSLVIPSLIMTESLVSFLGVGVQEPDTSWGALISEGAKTMQYGTYWQLLVPAVFFVLAQVSLYYIGDGLRDALDPRER